MRKKKLLFICLGNICRSPAANGIMQHIVDTEGLADNYRIDSAGIGSWHVGQLPDQRMRRRGQAHGYTFDHRARQIRQDDFDLFDYIIVMDEENHADVTRLSPAGGGHAKVLRMADFLTCHPEASVIPDPYYGADSDFDHVIDLLEDACQGLLAWMENGDTHR